MEQKKTFKKEALLDEAAQLKIHGGTASSIDSNLTINIGKGCGTWGDCKKYCQIVIHLPLEPTPV